LSQPGAQKKEEEKRKSDRNQVTQEKGDSKPLLSGEAEEKEWSRTQFTAAIEKKVYAPAKKRRNRKPEVRVRGGGVYM